MSIAMAGNASRPSMKCIAMEMGILCKECVRFTFHPVSFSPNFARRAEIERKNAGRFFSWQGFALVALQRRCAGPARRIFNHAGALEACHSGRASRHGAGEPSGRERQRQAIDIGLSGYRRPAARLDCGRSQTCTIDIKATY